MRVAGYEQMVSAITKALEERGDENLALWQSVLDEVREENALLRAHQENQEKVAKAQSQLELENQLWDMYDVISGNKSGFDALIKTQKTQLMRTLIESYKGASNL